MSLTIASALLFNEKQCFRFAAVWLHFSELDG